MVVDVMPWLEKMIGSHAFKSSTSYGNNNLTVRLAKDVNVRMKSGVRRFKAGTEVCMFGKVATQGRQTIAVVFEETAQTSIFPGGVAQTRPYKLGPYLE